MTRLRASRLLRILLLLQNRGRQSSAQLAAELEVAPRTILRDVDAMTEAGLPIIVHQGNQGGIELGFNYRTRFTGLARDEARALGLILSTSNPMIAALGLEHAAEQARAKLVESLPDTSRHLCIDMMARFNMEASAPQDDPRIRALARAVQARSIVRLRFATPSEQIIHPTGMKIEDGAWHVQDGLTDTWNDEASWGRLNISGHRFKPG
ncbi:HTH domain-containing protein [uncultured Tateyamaria sp.]|uniref:helix-turn-helix transcriptional regulator n=1 Tax=uncultured Tateyamaria sp. TaxID=455651 RepID=UPI00261DD5EA|nr:HTH domain-containing protein [uncultured Tateyamaria sp.]